MPIPIPPELGRSPVTCPQCGTVAEQDWLRLSGYSVQSGNKQLPDFTWCICRACSKPSLWEVNALISADDGEDVLKVGRQVWPLRGGPPPHEDMPADARRHYEQAREVLNASPQAASALLRVATESLVLELLGTSAKLNDAIGELLSSGRITPRVQQACDVLRVTGNDALHPGQIDEAEEAADATALFSLVNLIVEQAITEPKTVAAMYAALPATKREAIEKRDQRNHS
ncbi:hypothetical protein FHX74_002550 [Friedmanniella endophytica]|uniref:DUF4145 domain-containing protein n=1 Tax=Microlunatus kandeliicorticis TaxID=1759536 RepID=A0A7W3P6G2_9ACTN|nr:DUF4145 domain-containing protein [Microlunatus kandeliicorticis]MBA8794922.1 hypothetical protein [Microlunatus kandeliicorticis]